MNALQNKEFELLKCFVKICEELGLTYYLVCGSALGAVKYDGFIPWDDDIDVGMPREDYRVFCQKAQDLLPKGMFLQTYETDMYYPCIFAKIRNSETTYIEKTCAKIPMNHGVYIDIFPLDGCPENKREKESLERKKFFYKLMLSCVYESECSIKVKVLRKFFRIMGIHRRTNKVLSKYDALISAYPIESSEIWCNHGNWQGRLEYAAKEQYGNGTMAVFEGMHVRIPEKYDEYLSQKYGNWRADLPLEQQVGHHYYAVCDLDKPYTEYMMQF